MTPRQKRIAELKAARARIDAELGRLMGGNLPDLPEHPPVTYMTIERAAAFARQMVHSGRTHAEIARELDIRPESVAGLIAGRWVA